MECLSVRLCSSAAMPAPTGAVPGCTTSVRAPAAALGADVVHDPVEVLSDPGVDAGHVLGAAAGDAERHHADDPVRRPELVDAHQRTARVARARVLARLAAGAHLVGPDNGLLTAEHPAALLVRHHRHLQLHQQVARVADCGHGRPSHIRRQKEGAGHGNMSIVVERERKEVTEWLCWTRKGVMFQWFTRTTAYK